MTEVTNVAAERPTASAPMIEEFIPPGTRARLLPLREVAARPLTTVGIGSAGFTDAPAGYRRSVLGPLIHRAMITLSGSGFFQTGHERFELPPGSMLVWPAGLAAAYGTTSETTWGRAWVALADIPRWAAIKRGGVRCEVTAAGEKLRIAMEGIIAELGPAKPEINVTPERSAQLLRAGESTGRGSDLPAVPRNSAIDPYGWAYPPRPDGSARARAIPANLYARILRAYVHTLLRVPDIERVESDGARLDQLWAHVQEHLSQEWTVDTLAKRMAVAPATLHRMTQRRYGTTPGGLLLRMRMEEAQRLLALTDEPVQKLAERFGYASPFAFSTAFKRATGLAPRAFREQRRA
jgi:AraC-like DNA-binding protein